jgi:hypothetical protein
MVEDFSKLMLRAYNAEADNLVRGLKPYRLDAAIERLPKVAATIARLGATMDFRVSETYQALRVREGCTARLAGASRTGCYLRGAQTR